MCLGINITVMVSASAASANSVSLISDGYRKPPRLCARPAIPVHVTIHFISPQGRREFQQTGIAQQISDRTLNNFRDRQDDASVPRDASRFIGE